MSLLSTMSDPMVHDGSLKSSNAGNNAVFHGSEILAGHDETEMPIQLLTEKMIDALKSMGYNENEQATVTRLVLRNTRLVHGTSAPNEQAKHDEESIAAALDQLLSDRSWCNSNEPVLIATIAGTASLDESRLQQFMDDVLHQLQGKYGINPVRVAVADYGATPRIEDETSDEQRVFDFSLTLLNVVNTDIGGPSMIQLFDHGQDAEKWSKFLLWSEAWDRGHCLWRVPGIKSSVPEETFGTGKESLDEPVKTGMDQDDPFDHDPTDSSPNLDDQHNSQNVPEKNYPVTEVSADHGDAVMSSSVQSEESSNHPAFVELRAKEPQEQPIVHPTWQHVEASGSLADLIRQQSSQISAVNDDTEAAVGKKLPAARSEDDFELV